MRQIKIYTALILSACIVGCSGSESTTEQTFPQSDLEEPRIIYTTVATSIVSVKPSAYRK